MHPAFAKIKKLSDKLGPNITPVEITVGGETETFNFKRLPYGLAKQLATLTFEFKPGEDGESGVIVHNPQLVGARDIKLIFESLVDDQGKQFLTEDEIAALPIELCNELFKAATKVNAMNSEAIGDATKNSKATDSEGTSSNSPTVAAAQ